MRRLAFSAFPPVAIVARCRILESEQPCFSQIGTPMPVHFFQRILPAVFLVLLASPKQAYAQGVASGGGSLLQGLMPLLLIVAVMYFLLIRPQQKRTRQHRELVSALRRGDKVLTSGGFYAVVTRVIDERDIEVELAGKTKVKMLRSSVLELVASPPPAKRR